MISRDEGETPMVMGSLEDPETEFQMDREYVGSYTWQSKGYRIKVTTGSGVEARQSRCYCGMTSDVFALDIGNANEGLYATGRLPAAGVSCSGILWMERDGAATS